jgi:hypothetical protein
MPLWPLVARDDDSAVPRELGAVNVSPLLGLCPPRNPGILGEKVCESTPPNCESTDGVNRVVAIGVVGGI